MDKKSFSGDIKKFNRLYGLPVNSKPTLPDLNRIVNFKKILDEEVSEFNDIISNYKIISKGIFTNSELKKDIDWKIINEKINDKDRVKLLTDLSDLLGDIVVYVTSEATKYGLDLRSILKIIMESNFSKLGKDGKPIYDERGKVLKGPDYWKPESKINEFLDKLDK